MSSSRADLARPHVLVPGSGQGAPVLLALHQTGGTEMAAAEFARSLDPTATVLAPRGSVREGPYQRWFRRHSEGVFDVDDVLLQAEGLASFVRSAIEAHELAGRPLIAVGFSNGANIALALAFLHPELLRGVAAFSGMYPFADRLIRADLEELPVLLLNGTEDDMAPQQSVDRLEDQLRGSGAHVTRRGRPGGHGVTTRELDAAKRWLQALDSTS